MDSNQTIQLLVLVLLVVVVSVFTGRNSDFLSQGTAERKSSKDTSNDALERNGPVRPTPIVSTPVMPSSAYISRWERAILEAEAMLANSSDGGVPSCLLPNTKGTADMLDRLLRQRDQKPSGVNSSSTDPLLSLPVLNVGMPKTGSSTLASFFKCSGFKGSHHYLSKVLANDKRSKEIQAPCMRDAARLGLPILKSCAENEEYLMQMDAEYPFTESMSDHISSKFRDDCFFPQLELLEALHDEAPNATYILPFRPITDWIKSMKSWNHMLSRFSKCNFPNMRMGLPENLQKPEPDLKQFLCSHVLHVRHFVEEFPSHNLIELDLYDQGTSGSVLSTLFPKRNRTTQGSCWGHANAKASVPQPKRQNSEPTRPGNKKK
ncbi:hypothetical protein IV203_013913 [Nitzschia inconspicua]|uniref:Sulfotransferase n=1 Tax=Nitzschia inconspicua TaxID=303405 RepID=A0A9K3Q8E2_9STRA|nr:hypothetical protein IV203_013913 [Nitzschia inconspicua]